MKKKYAAILLTMSLVSTAFYGCGDNTASSGALGQGTAAVVSDVESGTADSRQTTEIQSQTDSVFSELSKYHFTFSSGAGAWSTELTVGADGSFLGDYHDSDAGSTGEGYPYGTVYMCQFSGRFTTPEKINDYTYKTTIESISCEQESGTEEIVDDMKFVYSEPYGLDNAKDIYIYVKGAPVSELPEAYCSWVNMAIDGSATLPFYGIYNENNETGFSGWEDSGQTDTATATGVKEEDMDSVSVDGLDETEQKAAAIEERLNSENLTQVELNELSEELYTLWDTELNVVWKQLKNTLDSDTMSELTTQEKEWIQEKEQKVQAAGAEYEGGSIQPLVMNTEGADLTKARVYELVEYLK